MKKTSRLTVILYALCAIIWTIRAVLEIAYQTYHTSVFLFVLNVLCAVVWIAAWIVNWKRYCSNRDK